MIYIFITLMVVCILALVKNQINYSIRQKWISEIFSESDWFEKQKLFWYYSYDKTFLDMTLWKYIPFDEYVKNSYKDKFV